jgi:hypothetical protein
VSATLTAMMELSAKILNSMRCQIHLVHARGNVFPAGTVAGIDDPGLDGLDYTFSAKGAAFTSSLGQRPRINGNPKTPALKARFRFGGKFDARNLGAVPKSFGINLR